MKKVTKKKAIKAAEGSNDATDFSDSESDLEDDLIEVEGVKGRFRQVKSMNDIYGERPEKIETITLSQFATSYRKCQKKPKHLILNKGFSDEEGNIIEHVSEKRLPLYIELMNSKEVYRLRKFSTVLRIHASSKKQG